jgi:hypothetical protein
VGVTPPGTELADSLFFLQAFRQSDGTTAGIKNQQRLARLDVFAGAPAQITRDRDIYRIRNSGLFQLVLTIPPSLHRPEDPNSSP